MTMKNDPLLQKLEELTEGQPVSEGPIRKMVKVVDSLTGETRYEEEKPELPKRFCKIVYMVDELPQECGGEVVIVSQFHRTGPVIIGGRSDGYTEGYGVCNKCKVRYEC